MALGMGLHPALDGGGATAHVGGRMSGIALQGVGERDGYQGALPAGEIFGRLVKPLSGHCFGSVDAGAHLYGVEVDLQDALFGPKELYQHCKICFEAFTYP